MPFFYGLPSGKRFTEGWTGWTAPFSRRPRLAVEFAGLAAFDLFRGLRWRNGVRIRVGIPVSISSAIILLTAYISYRKDPRLRR